MSARVTIIGNVGKEPEIKVSQGGKSYAKFSIATRSGKKLKDGSWAPDRWFEVMAFGPLCDQVSSFVRRGSYVEAEGKFDFEEYEKKDGTRGQKFTCLADRVTEKEKPASKVQPPQSEAKIEPNWMKGLGGNIDPDSIPF